MKVGDRVYLIAMKGRHPMKEWTPPLWEYRGEGTVFRVISDHIVVSNTGRLTEAERQPLMLISRIADAFPSRQEAGAVAAQRTQDQYEEKELV